MAKDTDHTPQAEAPEGHADSPPLTPQAGENSEGAPTVAIHSMPVSEERDNDPFDLDRLRLSQDFKTLTSVKKLITTVKCDKPNPQVYVRVRPGEQWRLETLILEDKVNRDRYLVDPRLRAELLRESYPACLFTAVTKQGDPFLWPVRLPAEDGRSNPWFDSALAAARLAETSWIRMVSNVQAGCYDTYQAAGNLGEASWPEIEFQELIRLAFRDRMIRDLDHPVLRGLRGEI